MNERPELSPEWWDDLDKYWKWVAKDSSGTWMIFARKPSVSGYCWAMGTRSKWGRWAHVHHVYPSNYGEIYDLDVPWKDSLYRRPKKKKKPLCRFSATLNGVANDQAFSQANCCCQLKEGHEGDHHVLVRSVLGVNCVVAMPNDGPEPIFTWKNIATAESVPKPQGADQAGKPQEAPTMGLPNSVGFGVRVIYRSLRRQGFSPYEATNRIFEMAECHTKQAEAGIAKSCAPTESQATNIPGD